MISSDDFSDTRFKGLFDELDAVRNNGDRRQRKPPAADALDPFQGFEEDDIDTTAHRGGTKSGNFRARGGRVLRLGGLRNSKWFAPAASSVHVMETRKKLY